MEDSSDRTIHAIRTAAEKLINVYRSADVPVPQSVSDRLVQSMKTVIKSKLEYNLATRAENETDDAIRDAASELNEAEVEVEEIENQIPDGEQVFEQRLAAAPKITARQIDDSEPVKQLVRLLKPPAPPASAARSSSQRSSRRQHDTSELEELDAEQNIPIDPFSQREMQFAVKNKHCGHKYDKSSLEAYLKQSANPKCPNIGCGNKRKLTMTDVSPDEETNALIQQKRGSATQ